MKTKYTAKERQDKSVEFLEAVAHFTKIDSEKAVSKALIKIANDAQKTFIVQVNCVVQPVSYTSLKQACSDYGVSYPAAVKGKRKFLKKDNVITISETGVKKISGRENNFKSGK